MSRRSKVVQGAIIGGIAAVVVHFAVRFVAKNWMVLLFLSWVSGLLSACVG